MNREFCGTTEVFREARQLRKMNTITVGGTIRPGDFLTTNQGLLNNSPIGGKTVIRCQGLPEPGEGLFRQKSYSFTLGRMPAV